MNPFTRLDSLLLRATQWLVDRIGGDYMGQRIGRQMGIFSCLGMLVAHWADYRTTGFNLVFFSLMWGFNIYGAHLNANVAMDALHKGFANPMRDDVFWRVFMVIVLVLGSVFCVLWDHNLQPLAAVRMCLLWPFVAHYYFLATENPPPKKSEAKDEVTGLDVAPQES